MEHYLYLSNKATFSSTHQEEPTIEKKEESSYHQYHSPLLKFFLATWIIVSGIGSAQFSDAYQQRYHYDSPYLVNYLAVSSQAFLLPILPFVLGYYNTKKQRAYSEYLLDASPNLSVKRFLFHCILSTFIWISCFFLYSFSIRYTTAASDAAIFNSAPIFAFILSVLFLKEIITFTKVLACILCFFGVGLLAFGDESATSTDHHRQHLVGDGMSFLSALLYSIFLVHLKHLLGKANVIVVLSYTVFMGVVTLILYWPIFFLLANRSVEPWVIPSNDRATLLFFVAIFGNFLENIITFGAIACTTPLFVVISGTLAIPCSVAVSIVIYLWTGVDINWDIVKFVGLFFIIVGFIANMLDFPIADKFFNCVKSRKQYQTIP